MQDIVCAAVQAFESGCLDEAIILFEQAVALDPTNAAAMHSLGVIHNQRCDFRRAIDWIGRALALRPFRANFFVNLGEAYRNLGEFERAVNSCRLALDLDPSLPEALNTIGLALHGLNRHDEAIDHFSRAIALRPDMASAHNNLGLVLQELERYEEAILHFRHAVDIAPELHRARTNLGLALLVCGWFEEAIHHFREAIRHQPGLAVLHHNLGNALRLADRIVEARSAYLEALLLEPQSPLTRLHIGLTLRHEGKFGEALPWHKRAVDLDSGSPLLWRRLAELYRDLDEPAQAIPCWERVLALSPADEAVARIGLGGSLQDEGRLSEAMEQFRSAASLRPNAAAAWWNMGNLFEIIGNMAEAEAAFREAIRLQPEAPVPHARLATLLRGEIPDPDLAVLEDRLADPALHPQSRARLLFALAHVRDARGDYARAADCLREANALTVQYPTDSRQYIPSDHERFVNRVMRVFSARFFARLAHAGLETRRPIFVFGLPRSGTTLIEQVLASHPNIHGAGEQRFSRKSLESIPSLLGRPGLPLECVPHLDVAAIRRLGEEHLEKLRQLDDGRAEGIVDKMPDNYLFLGLLAVLFPRAVFIHCRRDLRDVAVSCWMTDFGSIRWANRPENIASRFRQYVRLMDHWQANLPVKIHEVQYEETVNDLEGVARRLLSACDQEWNPACLEFHRTQRAVRTASITQVRQPIYKKSVARWKNYETELFELFTTLSPDRDTKPNSPEAAAEIAEDEGRARDYEATESQPVPTRSEALVSSIGAPATSQRTGRVDHWYTVRSG
jgi:tetratricopeptide (TPR) repeat protein